MNDKTGGRVGSSVALKMLTSSRWDFHVRSPSRLHFEQLRLSEQWRAAGHLSEGQGFGSQPLQPECTSISTPPRCPDAVSLVYNWEGIIKKQGELTSANMLTAALCGMGEHASFRHCFSAMWITSDWLIYGWMGELLKVVKEKLFHQSEPRMTAMSFTGADIWRSWNGVKLKYKDHLSDHTSHWERRGF